MNPDNDGVDVLGLFREASANVRVHGWLLGPAGELRGCTPTVVLTKLNATERQTASLLERQCFAKHKVASLRPLPFKLALCIAEATSNTAGPPHTFMNK